MKTNTKHFPKGQLFDLEFLEQMEKGLEKNNLNPNLLKMAAFNFIPISGPRASSFVSSLCSGARKTELDLMLLPINRLIDYFIIMGVHKVVSLSDCVGYNQYT